MSDDLVKAPILIRMKAQPASEGGVISMRHLVPLNLEIIEQDSGRDLASLCSRVEFDLRADESDVFTVRLTVIADVDIDSLLYAVVDQEDA